jgi:hypothetical protein
MIYLYMRGNITVNNLAEDEIDYRNMRYSGSRPRPLIVSEVDDNIMIELVVICKSGRAVRIWTEKRAEFYQ